MFVYNIIIIEFTSHGMQKDKVVTWLSCHKVVKRLSVKKLKPFYTVKNHNIVLYSSCILI